MRPLSITLRISLLFAVAVAVVLLGAGFFLARAVEAHFVEEDRHDLDGKLALIRHLLESADPQGAGDRLRQRLTDALVGHHNLALAMVETSGAIRYAKSVDAFPSELLRPLACVDCPRGPLRQWARGGREYRGLAVAMPAGGDILTVAVALDIEHHQSFMAQFRRSLALAMALAALATAALGWVATRRGLTPLRRVTDLAATVSADRLASRLPDADVPVELQALVDAFNAMLARLDESFRRLSHFSSDIAHELRTPISNLLTQTQVALSAARDSEAYREILYSSLEEYERMAQMVGDMLYLAQADNGLLKPGNDEVDLAVEVRGLFDYFDAWAEEARVSLVLSGSARIRGDRLMLRRALSNLIGNAIRHAPPEETVRVNLAEAGEAVSIAVENPGPEIPARHLGKLFDRFYRVDPSRQRLGEGAGLGLAIVKSIVTAHGGAVSVTSAVGRTRFVVTLPRQARAPGSLSTPAAAS